MAYLDNAATTQKPDSVIDAVANYYRRDNANVHRGLHTLSERATAGYESARGKVADFVGGASNEIVFVRGCTEAINLVAWSYGGARLEQGDEVVITALEHHSNIVPWQMVCEATGANLKVAPITDAGELDMDGFEAALGPRTRIVAVAHVSNALGSVLPVADVVQRAKARGATVVVDGAQAAPHLTLDVSELGCDFYAISGHKMYGPTGIGALWGRRSLLEAMPPYQGGGEMIRSVTFQRTDFAAPPARFEAGTPNIAGAVGLGAAIDFMTEVGAPAIAQHEAELLDYATRRLADIPGVSLIGTAEKKASVLSFTMEGTHPHDIGTIVDSRGIAIRAGHHCAQPLMQRLGLPATARASFACYNTEAEVDRLIEALGDVREMFS